MARVEGHQMSVSPDVMSSMFGGRRSVALSVRCLWIFLMLTVKGREELALVLTLWQTSTRHCSLSGWDLRTGRMGVRLRGLLRIIWRRGQPLMNSTEGRWDAPYFHGIEFDFVIIYSVPRPRQDGEYRQDEEYITTCQCPTDLYPIPLLGNPWAESTRLILPDFMCFVCGCGDLYPPVQ
jgi:hypothetical protein